MSLQSIRALAFACAAAVALTAASASAALNAYMTVTGQKQGPLVGSVTSKGHEKQIAVIAATLEASMPFDANSGQPSGKRLHKPITIVKEVDHSSSSFFNAFTTRENLSTVTIVFYAPNVAATTGVGSEAPLITVKLTNANITSYVMRMPNVKDPTSTKTAPYEEISFTYQKIELTPAGGQTATDNWIAQ